MNLHTKNEVQKLKSEQADTQTDRQTSRHDRTHYQPALAGGNDRTFRSLISDLPKM